MLLVVEFDDEWAGASEWARMYRGLGLQVVPAALPTASGHWKRPVVDWLEFQHNLIPDSLFDRWYGKGGEHERRKNMGLITGAASGGLLVIDLDTYKNANAWSWWSGLLEVHANGIDLETWRQFTGGGGLQLIFRCPPGYAPPTFKAPPQGVDVRGQGGFIVCPPSMHSSGKAYEWVGGQEPWDCELAMAPDWLLEAVETLREEHGGQPTGPREHVASEDVKNAFGLDVDDREHKLQAAVWAAVVDLYRAAPIRPGEVEQQAERDRLWSNYERTTKTRLAGVSNADGLEREGRGRSELDRKWSYAMKRWDTRVKTAAAEVRLGITGGGVGETAPPPSDPPERAGAEDPDPEQDSSPALVDAGEWSGEPPERQWVVPEWIVAGAVNSLYGDGGLGKTLLAQQLGYASQVGGHWLGMKVAKGDVLGVFCEDDEAELHRRHKAIKTGMGYPVGNPFAGAKLWPRIGAENVLVSFDRQRNPVLHPFLNELSEKIGQLNPALLIIDTLADVFGGDEMDRPQVNYFAKRILGGLIRTQARRGHVMTILLLGHPSVSGMQQGGRGYSGSTAWNNAVRSRIYLSRPEEGGPDERLLARGKANYASSGDETAIRLGWQDGAFVHERAADDADPILRGAMGAVEQMVAHVWGNRTPYVSVKGHKRNVFAKLPKDLASRGYDATVVRQAVRLLADSGRISLVKRGSLSGWDVTA